MQTNQHSEDLRLLRDAAANGYEYPWVRCSFCNEPVFLVPGEPGSQESGHYVYHDHDQNVNVGREHAYKYGIAAASNAVVAGFLLNIAERDVITVSHGIISLLVEAAARVDGDTYLAWIKTKGELN